MSRYGRNYYHTDSSPEFTLREIIFSLLIVGVLFGLFWLGHEKLAAWITEKNSKIDQTIRIADDPSMFRHCLDTSPGPAICEGTLEAVDTVSDWDSYVPGKHLGIKRILEEYRSHTRIVTYTDAKGHVHTRTQTYHSWDEIKRESRLSKTIRFCCAEFPRQKIEGVEDWNMVGKFKIKTGFFSNDRRYIYYTIPIRRHGSILTNFADKDLAGTTTFFEGLNPEQVAKNCRKGAGWYVMYWTLSSIVIVVVVIGFWTLENRWLNS